jgi:Protein of unknown function (DUF2589)
MAEVIGIQAVRLFELLGSAMVAVVQADALAAKSTLEYIETVGFVAPPTGTEEDGGVTPSPAGDLRMASFRYRKLDENNEVADFVAEVPVLSLVSIPSLQVRRATFSLAIKIDDITKTTDGAETGGPQTLGPPSRLVPFLQPSATHLIARPATRSGSRTEEITSSHNVQIEINMAQADVPVGLEKIFNLMDQAIQDRKLPT